MEKSGKDKLTDGVLGASITLVFMFFPQIVHAWIRYHTWEIGILRHLIS